MHQVILALLLHLHRSCSCIPLVSTSLFNKYSFPKHQKSSSATNFLADFSLTLSLSLSLKEMNQVQEARTLHRMNLRKKNLEKV